MRPEVETMYENNMGWRIDFLRKDESPEKEYVYKPQPRAPSLCEQIANANVKKQRKNKKGIARKRKEVKAEFTTVTLGRQPKIADFNNITEAEEFAFSESTIDCITVVYGRDFTDTVRTKADGKRLRTREHRDIIYDPRNDNEWRKINSYNWN